MTTGFRLSPQQERIWTLQEGGRASYWVQAALRLTGPLDRSALEASITRLVERYEILRTTFPRVSGMSVPLQSIGGEAVFRLDEHDLSGEARESQVAALLELAEAVPFDFANGPLLHVSLATAASGESLLLLRLPALCADTASLLRLLAELRAGYAAALGEAEPPAGEPVQFADLAAWQNELLESDEMEAGRAFWRRQEAGDLLALRLPFAAAGAAAELSPRRTPRRIMARLEPGVARRLNELAEERAAPLASLLSTAWQAFLARFCGTSDLVLGSTFDGRSYEALVDAVGPLARVLPEHTRLDGPLSFTDFWERCREAATDLYGWQEYFSWQELSLAATSGEPPFCALGFELIEWPEDGKAAGLTFAVAALDACLERFDLKLSASRGTEGTLVLELWYDPALYAEADVRRALGNFQELLASVAERPTAPLDELRFLSREESGRLAMAPGPAGREPGEEALVHRQLEHWARQCPDNPAVVFEDLRLSFGELNARANQLARHLRLLGVGPEVPVALCLERSLEVIVALLAVLKAGGAYLPLDPALPAERLRFMLADTGAPVVLTLDRMAVELPAEGVRRVHLDADGPEISRQATADLDVSPGSGNAAYILFTSGSTGQPKGVVVEHRQLASYVRGVLERLDLPPGSSYATVSTFAADLGNTVIYASLCTGGCLHVISQERLFDPDGFAEYFQAHSIDCLKIVPSHLEALLAADRPERGLPRRRLVLGGEASRRSWVEELRRLAPDCRILNHYGPTETTVGVLTYTLEAGVEAPPGKALPLGRPLTGSGVYVLDRHFEPVPLWMAGEILIGGDSVTRGYLNRPALTAERFVPDPFSGRPGARMYRTGDLGRVLPGGDREFLGRIDDQVKIHGFRVEPGEIEAVLAEHPEVRECTVLARDDEPGQRRLVAYLVPRTGAPRVADLRELLGRRLPEFMIPAAFVMLPSLPLNANGKVDRRRLPAPDPAQARSESYLAPVTPTEQALAEIWEAVLGTGPVGIRDNFFHLGGDSIRSIEVRAKARQKGLDFSIAEVFQHQTIERLARHLEKAAGSEPGEGTEAEEYAPFSLVPAVDREKLPAGAEDAYPLCMMQQGMLFHSLLSSDSATYHDVGSYRFRIPYDPAAFRRAAGTLVGRHAALRTSFDLTSFSEPLQIVHRQAEIPVETGDWSLPEGTDPEAAWDAWIDQEVRRPFRWDQAPLFRAFLHRLDDGASQVTVSFHHSILDGWSRHSLVTELIREYLRELGWSIPPLAPLPNLSYGELVALERKALASEEHHRFWRETLADAVRTKLPRRPTPPAQGGELRARLHVTFLPPPLSDGLHRLARASGVPIKSVLLAATLRMLSEHNGRLDAMNGLVVNGRPEKDDGDRASGLFLNTVPVRLRMDGGTWLDLVRAAYESEARLLPYRRFPIAELQRIFGRGEPLFETTFNYMHYHVYRRVLEVKELEFLAYKGFEETNLTCVVNFHQDPVNNDIQLGIEYHASVLFEEQIEKMAAYLLAIMGAMTGDPQGRYDLFSPLTEAERRQLLNEWNDTRAPYDLDVCLHDLCARQAERTPDSVAVVFGEARLTYADLDARANRLAHELRSRGVGPEVPVALFLERSLELMVALLGVLKAGGAYMPLDPDLPAARLDLMLGEARPPVVLTQSRLAPALPAASSGQVIQLDRDWEAIAVHPASAPVSWAHPDNAAYIIYTSGSTGQPKGAVNTHRGICNRLIWMQEAFGLDGTDRVLQKTPYSFDVSVWELFWPLMTGAALVLAEPGGQRDGSYLLRLISGQGITTLHFVPSMLQVFLEQPDVEAHCGGLRRVICSGEALPFELVRRFHERIGAGLHNLYGPTEAAVDVTWWPCRLGEGIVPIGRPIANIRIQLLNPQLYPVPVGVPGELMIGGVGLARGYLRRPGLTAERFIPDPWSGEPGQRLYWTGDLARWLPGGDVEYLGRVDQQVKIRGFRIELGEIEAALLRHPGVRESAVLVRGGAADPTLVAYWTAAAEPAPEAGELRAFLRSHLPEYMVPAHFVALAAMPLNPNGKLDRRALPDPQAAGGSREAAYLPPRGELERRIAAVWREVLQTDKVGAEESFFDLGGHSLHLLRVHVKLREVLGREIPMVELFRFPSIRALARHLSGGEAERDAPALGAHRAELRGRLGRESGEAVAVIGMSCRFPGAAGVEAFWRNLSQGVESIVPLSDKELLAAGIDPAWIADPAYIKAKGVLEDTDLFDAAFFGFSPMDAAVLDPQQRLFLECSWEAVEDAGYDSQRYPGAVGVYAGVGMSTYAFNLYSNPALLQSIGGYQAMLANDKDFLATRVSYKLDLRGPSMTVQTACSTSLVAIHLACQSLLSGECDMALAGGARVAVPQKAGYFYQEGGIHSPDGHCCSFDARSAGMVGGDGVGVVVLKRLSDALADGDPVRAVIRGSAVNNDGAQRVGYTAPGVEGQSRVVAEALAVAGVDARSIGYVEAHGTATELGDPVEIAGLTQAFRATTGDRGFCAIGSVKTNVGHLDAAAGVAGVIKTVLALEREAIPPSLHFERPNPRIDFASSPFYVNAGLRPWPRTGQPRRAGVSSLGIGGTNAHLVLEEAPVAAPAAEPRPGQLLILSARTETALEAAARRLAGHLKAHPEISLAAAAYTLQTGRRAFGFRRAVVCRDREDAVAALEEGAPGRVLTALAEPGQRRSVAFLFPGQGAQYAGMAAGLYQVEKVFRREVDRCAELLVPHLGLDLRRALHPREEEREAAGETLRQTAISQPALFVVEYALACLWREWGVKPDALLGHSIGEYVAATLAGVLSLEDALAAVAARGALVQSLPSGAMLAVSLPAEAVEPWLAGGLSLAAINAPSLSVLSGSAEAVAALEARLLAEGVEHRRLRTSHAFHSAAMEPAVAPFVERLSRIELRPPRIPFLSNVTGTWIRDSEATDPAYWGRHLRQPVRFAAGLAELFADPHRVLLEVGPGRTLATLARQHPGKGEDRLVLTSVRHPQEPQEDLAVLLNSLGRLWLAGVEVDWEAHHAGDERRRVGLPAYPFERRRFWIDRPRGATGAEVSHGSQVDRKPDVADWLYVPGWRRSPLPAKSEAEWWRCLLLTDGSGLGEDLARALEAAGRSVVRAASGSGFQRLGPGSWTLDPRNPGDYRKLLRQLGETGETPEVIVHLWSLAPFPDRPEEGGLGRDSLIYLVQALDKENAGLAVRIEVVSNGVYGVTGAEAVLPEKATLLAPCKVAPQEYPNLQCRIVDVLPPPPGAPRARLAALLCRELASSAPETAVAYRGGERWVESLEPFRLEPAGGSGGLRQGGVYLITGGLSGTALAMAELLAGAVRPRLVLLEEPGFPSEERWEDWRRGHGEEDEVSRRTLRAESLRRLGAEVLVMAMEGRGVEPLGAALAAAEQRFGPLHGVLHAPGQPADEPAFSPLGELDAERLRTALLRQAESARTLAAVLAGRDLDFCLLLSSNASILGGLGALPMAAASCFLDAFARQQAAWSTVPWMSANWDYWSQEQRQQSMLQEGVGLYDMSVDEGREVLRRLTLPSGQSRIAISPVDLAARVRTWVEQRREREPSTLHHPRPELRSDYAAPRSGMEQEIATIWQELLGVERVGVFDDFFELGGHSLLATRMASRLRAAFQVEVPLRSLFEAPTISRLAAMITDLQMKKVSQDAIARLLSEVKQLGGEDLQALLVTERQLNKEGKANG